MLDLVAATCPFRAATPRPLSSRWLSPPAAVPLLQAIAVAPGLLQMRVSPARVPTATVSTVVSDRIPHLVSGGRRIVQSAGYDRIADSGTFRARPFPTLPALDAQSLRGLCQPRSLSVSHPSSSWDAAQCRACHWIPDPPGGWKHANQPPLEKGLELRGSRQPLVVNERPRPQHGGGPTACRLLSRRGYDKNINSRR